MKRDDVVHAKAGKMLNFETIYSICKTHSGLDIRVSLKSLLRE
ncbi:hypothetical protein D3OALGA1CA_4855 [Olavius algarvensis associated proteobacterium Delta 3]|nr:hypothetical protein D3OALGB2SA_710 [Olavius algarvensis associated proteobacterium Delta 3]CAB5157932.1 hypothetical protein D3OALGA1CA_4855 [Olavius algarvensis associated proteobacterium Delta 3]